VTDADFTDDAPYHAHIYFTPEQRHRAQALRDQLASEPNVLFVGRMTEGKAGPHPIPQFEIHFLKRSLSGVLPMIEASGLRALLHPLTDDDLADHTSLGHWLGESIELDLTTLDPPGINQGVARFGKSDF
jgi:aromatic ring-cleaving dioxygenase